MLFAACLVLGAAGTGCAIGEWRQRRSAGRFATPVHWRRARRVLTGLLLLPLYLLLGEGTSGLAIFGVVCVLPVLATANRPQFRGVAWVSATVTGLVGLSFLLPFFWLAAPLLWEAACTASAARMAAPGPEGQSLWTRSRTVRLVAAAELVVLGSGLAVALSARPG